MEVEIRRCLLGEILRKSSINQRQLAHLSGKTESQISEYITGSRRMSLTTAVNIARILGCKAEDLYEWTPIEE
jgi:plasmid maintenance system antidote protein VapI